MTVPAMSPFHVDASRIGGSSAAQRHNFAIASATPPPPLKKPRFIDPPPKRDLGQGTPQAPAMSQADLEKFQTTIKPIIEALQLEIEATKTEADMVSGPTLRVEPDLYKSISIIGPYFTPQEVRSTILVDANQLESVANRILTGSLGSYLAHDQKAAVSTAVSDAKKLASYIQQFDLTPLSGASAKFAQDHVDSHITQVLDEVKEAEKNVVTVEAGGIPVIEPMEKGMGPGGLLAIGTLIAVGIIIADLI